MNKKSDNLNKSNNINNSCGTEYTKESDGKQYSVAVINLGCKVNRYEADSMKRIMADYGIVLVEPEDIADFYIVNTCSVTNVAERKSRQMLRRAKRKNPEAIVIAAGCYVNAAHDELLSLDFVDAVIGNDKKNEIINVLEQFMSVSKSKPDMYVEIASSEGFEEMGELTASYLDHQRAYIKVQDGCNQFCSYCIIPYTRGRIRSRNAGNIIEEIRGLAKSGVKEFVLTGIHISSYGRDFSNHDSREITKENNVTDNFINDNAEKDNLCVKDLADLICAVSKIKEVRRIRLGSLEPRIITTEFLDRISKVDKLCPHFHLSLQSACNETLKRMNRKYTIEEYMSCCELIRQYYDRPAITTDVIVGFPGETEEEFNITLSNLEILKLYEIHVFKYSVRRGTVAEKMPNQVPENVKNIRSDILLKLTEKQKKEFELSLSGLTDEVLVEEVIEMAGIDTVKQDLLCSDVINSNNESDALCLEEQNKKNFIKSFTGYTKRYVRVEVASDRDIIGEILPFTF